MSEQLDTADPWDRRADDILRVEALTSWCRKHIEPPPADILYGAVNALERLRTRAITETYLDRLDGPCRPSTGDAR